tara:strand:+ start:154 stop:1047 length:894 start_codon:yes stop_codon:yes gene_type:complete
MDSTKRKKENDYSLMSEWFKLQREMWNNEGNNDVINTTPILQEFMKQCHIQNYFFQSFNQNDCQEFINLFIDLLHDSIKRRVKIDIVGTPKNKYDLLKMESIKAWSKFFESSYSYIINTFYSKLLSLTSCPECGYLAKNHEPISTITLSLNTGYNTIYDCLDEFIDDFTLDDDNTWNCEKCKKDVCPQKKINFWELSPVLILLIKRFRKGGKILQRIKFPEELNMKNYCISKKYNNIYHLSGICVHSGGLNGGHYYALCKDHRKNVWYKLNDSHSSIVSLEDVLSEDPYCLFYVRSK